MGCTITEKLLLLCKKIDLGALMGGYCVKECALLF